MAWLSDVHANRDTWFEGELDAYIAAVNQHAPDVVITTGDNVERSDSAAWLTWERARAKLNACCYDLPGNHDVDLAVPEIPYRFSFDYGNFRFIGFFASYVDLSPPAYMNTGQISATDQNYLDAQLDSLGGKIPIVLCHYPLSDQNYAGWYIQNGYGREALLASLAAHNVKAFLHGHTHGPFASWDVSGTLDVNGGPGGLSKYFQIIDVYDDHLDIKQYSSTDPMTQVGDTITVTL